MTRGELISAVGSAIATMQDASQAFDQAAASRLGINLTDLVCLRHLLEQGPASPGELADVAGRTPAAMTSVVDRLESLSLVARGVDPLDRRRSVITATDSARRKVAEVWGEVAKRGGQILSEFNDAELETILRFVRSATQLHVTERQRIEQL